MAHSVSAYGHLETRSARFAEDDHGLSSLRIASPLATARIFVQGAHVCEWAPTGAEPVLFVSKQSHFASGKPIRGGVPVCFPWFAANNGNPALPAHGFVRAADWSVDSLEETPDGEIRAVFAFSDSDFTRALWPHAFRIRYTVEVGRSLRMRLSVENTDSEPFSFEAALHTYIRVADVRSVTVSGLEETEYIDKVDGGARKRQSDQPLRFHAETDRVFLDTPAACEVDDPGLNRRVSVSKTGSLTTVVWNPWVAKAAAMADFGDSEWPKMLCIETANAGENAVSSRPGETHEMTATISLQ